MRSLLWLALLGVAAAPAAATGRTLVQGPPEWANARFKPGEVLVQFEAGADPAAELRGLGATPKKQIATPDGAAPLVLAELPPGLAVAGAVAAFNSRPAVRFAEPNFIYTKVLDTNDDYWSDQYMWGMKGAAQGWTFGSNAATAWDAPLLAANTQQKGGAWDCSNVAVGVIDEGIQYTHPDLAANIWTNLAEANGVSGNDEDGNNYIDDIHGWNFFNDNAQVYVPGGDAHGTHVSGTIGGVGNNEKGVVGVCHSVKIVSAKFLGPNGGYLSDAVDAVYYLAALNRRGVPLVASSNSWGGGGFSQSLLDAINYAYNSGNGMLFIAAAGNDGRSRLMYPAAYSRDTPAVISVASLDSDGALSYYSNYGSWVHLGAPGRGILSSVPDGTYAVYSGTSMATPHVSGAAALYKARYPGATADDVRTAILNSVAPTASLANGITATGGRLDCAALLTLAPCTKNTPCNSNQFCTGNTCTNCPTNCLTCTSATSCTSCKSGFRGTTCSTSCSSSEGNCRANSECCSSVCYRNTKRCK